MFIDGDESRNEGGRGGGGNPSLERIFAETAETTENAADYGSLEEIYNTIGEQDAFAYIFMENENAGDLISLTIDGLSTVLESLAGHFKRLPEEKVRLVYEYAYKFRFKKLKTENDIISINPGRMSNKWLKKNKEIRSRLVGLAEGQKITSATREQRIAAWKEMTREKINKNYKNNLGVEFIDEGGIIKTQVSCGVDTSRQKILSLRRVSYKDVGEQLSAALRTFSAVLETYNIQMKIQILADYDETVSDQFMSAVSIAASLASIGDSLKSQLVKKIGIQIGKNDLLGVSSIRLVQEPGWFLNKSRNFSG
jgi:hypothetical protein